MKFEFYLDSKKKKVQVIKAKSNEELLNIIKIAKCELTKNSLLKDLDFSANGRLMCKVKDKVMNMKELWAFLETKVKFKDDLSKSKKSSKDNDKKKKKSSKLSEVNGSKKKKKKDKKNSKKKKNSSKLSNPNTTVKSSSDGLVHITRR